jgi:hypothetical protein
MRPPWVFAGCEKSGLIRSDLVTWAETFSGWMGKQFGFVFWAHRQGNGGKFRSDGVGGQCLTVALSDVDGIQ